MKRRWYSAIGAMAGSACMLASGTSASAARREGEPSIASFDVVATCPTRASFAAEVRRRTHAPRHADATDKDNETPPAFRVTIEAQGRERYRGHIAVERGGSAAAERVVEGASCNEVMHALALVAALSIDPEGGGRERAEEDEEAGGGPSASASANAGASASASANAGASASASAEAAAGERAEAARVAVSVGVHGAAQGGVAPGVVLTVPAFVEIAFARTERRGSLRARLAPMVRATFVRGGGDTSVPDRGTASFTWTAGELDLCPVVAEVERLSLVPCARLELGALNGAGGNIDPPRNETRIWAALAAPVRLRLQATRALFVELEGGPRVPLQRERFIFQPDITVFRAPAMAWAAGAGAGLTFP